MGVSQMGHGWRDLAEHHAWAKAQILAFCQDLDAPTLVATVPGTCGTIIETLQHLVDAGGRVVLILGRP